MTFNFFTKGIATTVLLSIGFAGIAQTYTPKGPRLFPGLKGFTLVSAEGFGSEKESKKNEADKKREEPDTVQTDYVYKFSSKSGQKPPTKTQLSEYYADLLKKAPGQRMSDQKGIQGGEFFAGGYVHNGREVWISIGKLIFYERDSSVAGYTMRYLENPEPGYIKASAMDKTIKKEGKVILDIHFEADSATVKEESLSQVYELVTMLRNDLALKVSIEVHTDKMGSAAQNKELSEGRAKAVRDIVRRKGIDPGRLSTIGWGWSKPMTDNKTEMGRAKNRRVEIVRK